MYSFGYLTSLFCVSYYLFCVSLWPLTLYFPPQLYPLYVSCLCSCAWYDVYQAFRFYGIPLTLIGVPIINWFTIKPNVDVGNVICTSILFSISSDSIKDCQNIGSHIQLLAKWYLGWYHHHICLSVVRDLSWLALISTVLCSDCNVLPILLMLGQFNMSVLSCSYVVLILMGIDLYWAISFHRRSNFLLLIPYPPPFLFRVHIFFI